MEFLANRKKDILERKERQEKLLAEKRAQLADREVPFQREQETIQHLIRYLHKMKVQHGLVDPEDEVVAQQVNQSLQNQHAAELIAKNISDGKMETAYERKGEALTIVGSKKGGKKKKVRTITVETTF